MNVAKNCRDINELIPTAQIACKLFLQKCKDAGLNVFITETYRSQERQNYLYEQGRTRPGQIVTWTRNSRHTSRRAWDIACNGTNLYDLTILNKAGAIAKTLGITWGGTWSTPDRPHFEIDTNWTAPVEKEEEPEMTYDQFKVFMAKYEAERNAKDVSEWAKASFEKATSKGILDGTKPHAPATREQVASIIDRMGLMN